MSSEARTPAFREVFLKKIKIVETTLWSILRQTLSAVVRYMDDGKVGDECDLKNDVLAVSRTKDNDHKVDFA